MLIILNLMLLFKVSIQVNGDEVTGEEIASPQIRFIYPFWLRPIYNPFYEPPSQDSAVSRDLSETNYYQDDRQAAEPQFPPALVYWRRRYPSSDDMTDFHSAKPCIGLRSDAGKCVHSKHCSALGGQPSGFCSLYSVCCVTKSITKCNGGIVTKNNTVWQGQLDGNSYYPACSVTIRPNSIKSRPLAAYDKDDEYGTYRHHNEDEDDEYEHHEEGCKKKEPSICQIRLDFTTLNIEQPDNQTVCNVDTFQVSGASNKVPVICGIANNQHMYLNVQKYPENDIQLLFKFGPKTSNRFWNINIAFLPCGADYLAPPGCLQYFVSSSTIKSVRSFNWVDVGEAPFISPITPISNVQELPADQIGTKARQLANQDYKICFRKEKILTKLASVICFTPCYTKFAKPFSLTTRSQELSGKSQSSLSECNNDFLLIPGGYNPKPTSTPIDDPLNSLDRYCGERLNPRFAAATSVKVCSRIEPFSIHYRTNGDETLTTTSDALGFGNLGFCLNYELQTH